MPRATGRKKRTIIEESIPDTEIIGGEPSDFDVSMEGVEDGDALKEVLSQFGETNLVLKILRQTPTGAEFCYQTTDLDEEFIQKNFGGGDYQVRIFIGGKYQKTIKVKIAARLESASNPVAVVDRHSEFLEKMLLALMSREQPIQQNPPTPVAELATAMKELHAINGGTSTEKFMESFLKGVEFAKDLNGGTGDWKSELIGAAKTVLPAIAERFGSMKDNAVPGSVPSPTNSEILLRSGLAYLKRKAIAGVDPMIFVDLVCVSSDEEQYQLLIREVLTKDFAEFAALDPEIGTEPFIGFFRGIYDGIRSAFTPPDSMADDTSGPVGDTADPGSDGANGAKGSKRTKVG